MFKMSRCIVVLFTMSCVIFTFIFQSSGQNAKCQTGGHQKENFSPQSCSFKLYNRNISETECKITEYEPSSKECIEMELKSTTSTKLCDVRIKTYANEAYKSAVDNITFFNNKWTYLKFKLRDRREKTKSICQEFHFLSSPDSWKSAVLIYDCFLFSSYFQHHEFDLFYVAGNSYEEEIKHYILFKPSCKGIEKNVTVKKRELFIYVDVTDAPNLQVRWQAVPGIKSYLVRAINEESGSVLYSETVSALPEEEELFYNTKIYGSKVYFTIQIKHENCGEDECISKSALIYMDRPPSWPYVVGASLTILILLLLCFIFTWFVRKLGRPVRITIIYCNTSINKCIFQIQLGFWQEQHLPIVMFQSMFLLLKGYLHVFSLAACPVVLIIYKRSAQSHVDVVKALADYLRKECHIDAKIDEFDIPHYVDKNPFNWCQETFKRANAVMVLSSPRQAANYETGIYRDVADVGLRLLQENFCDSNKKFFSVLLPYCEQKDIPVEAINLQCFKLTKDLDDMLWYIHNSNSVCLSRLRILMQTQMPGGKHKLGKQRILLNSIRKATEDVKRLKPQVVNTSNTTPPELPLVVLQESSFLMERNMESVYERNVMNPYGIHSVLTEGETYNGILDGVLNKDDNTVTIRTSGVNINDLSL